MSNEVSSMDTLPEVTDSYWHAAERRCREASVNSMCYYTTELFWARDEKYTILSSELAAPEPESTETD